MSKCDKCWKEETIETIETEYPDWVQKKAFDQGGKSGQEEGVKTLLNKAFGDKNKNPDVNKIFEYALNALVNCRNSYFNSTVKLIKVLWGGKEIKERKDNLLVLQNRLENYGKIGGMRKRRKSKAMVKRRRSRRKNTKKRKKSRKRRQMRKSRKRKKRKKVEKINILVVLCKAQY